MSGPHDSWRIFWMVRLLAAVGLTTILILLLLVGRQISSTQSARVKLQQEQERLYGRRRRFSAAPARREAKSLRFSMTTFRPGNLARPRALRK